MRRGKSKGGRPLKHPGEPLARTRAFRCRAWLDEKLQAEAVKSGRPVSQEIEHRLERSFHDDRIAHAHTGTDVGAELLRIFYSVMVLEGIHPDWSGDPVRAENFRVAMNGIITALLNLPFELPTPDKWGEGVETARRFLLRSSKQPKMKFAHYDPTADWDPSWEKWLAEEEPPTSKRKAGG